MIRLPSVFNTFSSLQMHKMRMPQLYSTAVSSCQRICDYKKYIHVPISGVLKPCIIFSTFIEYAKNLATIFSEGNQKASF